MGRASAATARASIPFGTLLGARRCRLTAIGHRPNTCFSGNLTEASTRAAWPFRIMMDAATFRVGCMGKDDKDHRVVGPALTDCLRFWAK